MGVDIDPLAFGLFEQFLEQLEVMTGNQDRLARLHGTSVNNAILMLDFVINAGRGAIRDVLDAEAAVFETRCLLHQAERGILIARLAEGLARGSLNAEQLHRTVQGQD
ncbi:hypothetical protein GSUB_11560 [Geoalkalibacter subterraneus]|uniref:Uncharacterized protein n=1 Tax=Geoalkalibacter subterraneus TaxID=483547 RepID=A0A0B5FIB5_9BACT|nr:hypothetical protein GSUB_11560 [Geoalkalibacter subterraneus]